MPRIANLGANPVFVSLTTLPEILLETFLETVKTLTAQDKIRQRFIVATLSVQSAIRERRLEPYSFFYSP